MKAQARQETGKGISRRLRRAGRVPAVVYGGKGKSLAVDVDLRELEAVLRQSGENVVIALEVEGAKTKSPQTVMLRDVKHGAVHGRLEHADFLRISLDEKIRLRVPVKTTGECEGVKMGGILEHQLWELEVECLPTQIPEAITVDVTSMEIGDAGHVRDLAAPEGVEIQEEADRSVVSVIAPKVAEVEEEVVPAAAAEPELVGAEDKEAREQEEKPGEEKQGQKG